MHAYRDSPDGPSAPEWEGYDEWLRDLTGCSECGSLQYRDDWVDNGWERYRVVICENCGAVDPDK